MFVISEKEFEKQIKQQQCIQPTSKKKLKNFDSELQKYKGQNIWIYTAAVNYKKPDIICGTESWLKGEKPGKNPMKDAIKSSEILRNNYTAYRNDNGTLGGRVFVLVHNDIIAVENPELVTNCELEWIETWKTSKS